MKFCVSGRKKTSKQPNILMKKNILLSCCLVSFITTLTAQTLFTYGNEAVTVQEFLKAYNKNNTAPSKDLKAVQNYLDLYIGSRLKIKEARALQYDTLPQLVADLQNLRSQIIPSYMKDEAGIKKLVDEAFTRSQKDIRVAHIYIAAGSDTAAARTKIAETYKKLMSGANFSTIAKDYSNDPEVKDNGGDIGYITVFSLPYQFENIVYKTTAGKLSPIYSSKTGYHIFKNLAERKALGRIRAAQILLALPPESGNDVTLQVKKLADSLYNLLQKGGDFGKLASQFSNDVVSAASKGQLPEFGVGEFTPVFESVVYDMSTSAVSKPFLTQFGWHIVKKEEKIPVPVSKNDAKVMEELRIKVEASDRINTTKDAMVQKILKRTGYKPAAFAISDLQFFTDSVLDGQKGRSFNVKNESVLFAIGKKNYTANDWVVFARTHRYKNDGSGIKTFQQLWDDYLPYAAEEYYKENLEQFNPDFKAQIDEFRDGNLFFEIMQHKVWGPAQTDTVALEKYYSQHKTKYTWAKSADAVIFYASDEAAAKALQKELTKTPSNWKTLVADLSDKIAADSNRFELAQIPNPSGLSLKEGAITAPLVNKADNTVSFAYIIRLHPPSEQRSFEEAKGLVINDYQQELEKKWIAELKRKYPVRINENVLTSLVKK